MFRTIGGLKPARYIPTLEYVVSLEGLLVNTMSPRQTHMECSTMLGISASCLYLQLFHKRYYFQNHTTSKVHTHMNYKVAHK